MPFNPNHDHQSVPRSNIIKVTEWVMPNNGRFVLLLSGSKITNLCKNPYRFHCVDVIRFYVLNAAVVTELQYNFCCTQARLRKNRNKKNQRSIPNLAHWNLKSLVLWLRDFLCIFFRLNIKWTTSWQTDPTNERNTRRSDGG